jgi:broad specificity phosphatase PhoE
MGRLFLIRHGQACFLEGNYDRLSERGGQQARLLGAYWAQRKVLFDRVCTGPCLRQKDTARFMSDAYRKAGLEFPEPLVLPEFDEYQGETVLERSLPGLLEIDTTVRDLHTAFQSSTGASGRRVTFQKLFEIVIRKWVEGAVFLPSVETWSKFCSRVNLGLAKFLDAGGRGERVAIVTSNSPIAVAMQRALNLSPQHTLQVSWMSRNSSWSEFLYSGDRFTLSAFNTHPHLNDSAMLNLPLRIR